MPITIHHGKVDMNKIVTANLEAIDQMVLFVEGLNESQYRYIASPLFESSIGQHLRHILDLYLALMQCSSVGNIDYDIRRRGSAVETSKILGLIGLSELRQWVLQIPTDEIERDVLISTEVTLSSQQAQAFRSSLGRELCFASSHLVHHLATMAVIAKLAGKKVDPTLGLAPATASFVRTRKKTACAR